MIKKGCPGNGRPFLLYEADANSKLGNQLLNRI